MKRVIIITDHYFDDRRGGGISSAVSNLFLHLDGEVNISIISFRKEDGKIRPIFFYHALLNFLFFNKNVVFYLTGIFNFHSNIVPIFLARFSRNKLIISPRGMLKSTALNKSKKKILFLKFVRFLLKKSTIIHVTDSSEQIESIFFFPTFKHIPILDFPPLRIKEFPQRTKESGEINLLYIGRIDELKNLQSVLVALKNLSTFLRNSALNSTKKIIFTIIGQKSDLKYYERCKKLIDEIVDLNEITISQLEFVSHDDLEKYFLDHHIFVSLSKGENFGYTIAESLAYAMPVIITPNSPFGKLIDLRIGSVVNGDDLNKVFNEILFYYNMSKVDYDNLSKNIFDSYNHIFRNSDLISEYKELFNV
jgi:glycosyltransferase involved in cell wall biosynthesis